MTATIQSEQERKRTLFETVFIYALNAAFAVFTTIVGAVLLPLVEEFGLPLARGSDFVSSQNTGCLVGILAVGLVVDRFDKRVLIFLSYALFAVSIIAIYVASSLAAFLLLLALAGFFTKIIDALFNATISQLHTVNKGFYMNLLHSFYGVGSFIGPLYAGMIAERFGGGWRLAYFLLGCLALILAFLYCAFFLRRKKNGRTESSRSVKTPAPSFRSVFDRNTLICMGTTFFYCGHQIGMNWLPTFMSETFASSAVTAASGLSIFWLGLIGGRLTCSVLTRKYSERTLIIAGNALGGALLFVCIFVGGEAAAFVGSALAGFFSGPTIPLALTAIYSLHPGAQGKVSMLMFIAISLGGIVGPWAMGLMVEAVNLTTAMYLNAVLILISVAVATLLPRRER